jgi:hypothetical protein
MKKIFLIVPILLIINGCATSSFMTVLPTCDIKVPTVAVETFRNDGRRIFENKCEIEQGKRCDSLYVDEVERFSYSSYTIDNLRYFRKMQKKECGF